MLLHLHELRNWARQENYKLSELIELIAEKGAEPATAV